MASARMAPTRERGRGSGRRDRVHVLLNGLDDLRVVLSLRQLRGVLAAPIPCPYIQRLGRRALQQLGGVLQ